MVADITPERYAAPASRPGRRSRWQRTALLVCAGLGIAVLAAGVFVISYGDLRALAVEGGATRRWAMAYPVMVDGLIVVTILSLVMARRARWWSRWLRWTLLLALFGAAGAAGVHRALYGYGSLPDRPLEVGVAVAPYVLLLIAAWLWLGMFQHAKTALGDAADHDPDDQYPDVIPGLRAPTTVDELPRPRSHASASVGVLIPAPTPTIESGVAVPMRTVGAVGTADAAVMTITDDGTPMPDRAADDADAGAAPDAARAGEPDDFAEDWLFDSEPAPAEGHTEDRADDGDAEEPEGAVRSAATADAGDAESPVGADDPEHPVRDRAEDPETGQFEVPPFSRLRSSPTPPGG